MRWAPVTRSHWFAIHLHGPCNPLGVAVLWWQVARCRRAVWEIASSLANCSCRNGRGRPLTYAQSGCWRRCLGAIFLSFSQFSLPLSNKPRHIEDDLNLILYFYLLLMCILTPTFKLCTYWERMCLDTNNVLSSVHFIYFTHDCLRMHDFRLRPRNRWTLRPRILRSV